MNHPRQVPILITLSDFTDQEIEDEAEDRGIAAVETTWYEGPDADGEPSADATAIFEAFYCGNEARALELVRAWVQNETGRVLP